jgi:MoxR-like ATPase
MNERQVTVDTTTHALDRPFLVLATQNPMEFSGTYPLPESQLDRFLVRVTIGYPEPTVERDVIRNLGAQDASERIEPILDAAQIAEFQKLTASIEGAEPVLTYLQNLVGETRESAYLSLGVSTRGAISFYRACQARAVLQGRAYILPDDVKALFVAVCGHRVMVKNSHDGPAERRIEAENVLREILDTTQVPL